MARAAAADFLQNFRFHAKVEIVGTGGDNLTTPAQDKYQTEAGFNSVTQPEYTTENAEYRDGITNYTMKQPAFPTVNEVTLSRGVVLNDTTFLDWTLRVFTNEEYRADVTILHYGKEAVEGSQGGYSDPKLGREIVLYNAFPIRVKPDSDLEATATDISLKEMDVAFEYFEIGTPDDPL